MILRVILLLILHAAVFASGAVVPQVDHVIGSLSNQQWEKDEIICRDKMFTFLDSVKNSTLWATWTWDSNPQASTGIFFGARYQLGNYDQCLRLPWLSEHPELKTQYCLADVEMSRDPGVKTLGLPGPYAKAEEYYVDGTTETGRSFSYMSYGVCLPAGCESKSVEKYVKALLSGQHLQAAWNADVKIHHCEEAGRPIVRHRGYYVYMYIFALLAVMALASTYYVYVSECTDTAKATTLVSHVAHSFCIRRNWATVFKPDGGALSCLHGIRFLSAVFMLRAHVFIFTNATSVSNGLGFEEIMRSPILGTIAVRFDFCVDTFFTMAGLLLGRTLSSIDVTQPYNLLKIIVRRYLRLIGPMAVTVFYIAYVLIHTDSGPQYPRVLKLEQQACEQNWWLSLLMLGNYVNTDAMCHLLIWSSYCDFHLYVMTVVLLYTYRKNPKVGKIATAIVVSLGILGPGISTYLYDFPAVWTLKLGLDVNSRIGKSFTEGYIKTHNRMGPYLAGLLVGYLMSFYQPTDYKKKMSKLASVLGVCAGGSVIASVIAVGFLCYKYHVYGPLACLYMILDRTTFAVGLLCIIICLIYGDVPFFKGFLSWNVFKPLGHLSYGMYLIHPVLLYRSKTALRDQLRLSEMDLITESLGTVVVSQFLSLVVWLLVEAPLNNFASRYLDIRSHSKEKASENRKISKNETKVLDSSDKQKVG